MPMKQSVMLLTLALFGFAAATSDAVPPDVVDAPEASEQDMASEVPDSRRLQYGGATPVPTSIQCRKFSIFSLSPQDLFSMLPVHVNTGHTMSRPIGRLPMSSQRTGQQNTSQPVPKSTILRDLIFFL